jgi:hypothetical protein
VVFKTLATIVAVLWHLLIILIYLEEVFSSLRMWFFGKFLASHVLGLHSMEYLEIKSQFPIKRVGYHLNTK